MESNQNAIQNHRKKVVRWSLAGVTLVLIGGLSFYLYSQGGLGILLFKFRQLSQDVPVVQLDVEEWNSEGEKIPTSPYARAKWQTHPSCRPHATLGDRVPDAPSKQTNPPADSSQSKPDCSVPFQLLNVVSHPVGASLYVKEGKEMLGWFENNPDFEKFSQTEVFKGLFGSVLDTLKIKAEDLLLDNFKGELYKSLMVNIVEKGELAFHYDVFHGKKGVVLSFRADKARVASGALFSLAPMLASAGYHIKALDQQIYEVLLGSQRLFVTYRSADKRLYLAYGLPALVSVMEKNSLQIPEKTSGTLVGTLRFHSWLSKELLQMISGKEEWSAYFSYQLSGSEMRPKEFIVESIPSFGQLTEKMGNKVPGSIPSDVFSAVAVSFPIPKNLSARGLLALASSHKVLSLQKEHAVNPQEGGLAVVWDLNGQKKNWITEVGLILSAGSEGEYSPIQSIAYDQSSVSYCKKNNVFLISRSDDLLRRMVDTCNQRSPSILDWKGLNIESDLVNRQSLVFANPAVFFKETFLAGTGPIGEWADKKEAMSKMAQDAESTFRSLSILGFSGNSNADTIYMSGFVGKNTY